jgi:hypothetical protein
MPYKTIVNFINGAVRTASEFYEDVTETVRAVTPEPIGRALDVLAGTVERGVAKSPIGVAERGAAATGQMVSRSTGNKVLGGAVEIGLGVAAGGPAVGSAAKRVIPKGVPKPKPAAPPIDMMMPPGMAPAMAGGAPMPPPMQLQVNKGGIVLKAVTSQHKEALALTGRKTGEEIVGADVGLGKQLTKRTKDILSKESEIKYLKETLEGLDELKGDPNNLMRFVSEDPDLFKIWTRYTEKYGADKVFAKVRSNLAEKKAEADTMWSRTKSNVLPFEKEGNLSKWYNSSAAKPFKQKAEKILRARGDLKIKEYLEQHHLIPKGMTAAYFDKMDQLIANGKAKLDDLVLMAEVAVAKGKPTGDVKVNIEDMIPGPHNEMHMVLRSQGAEVSKSKLIKDLSKVNSVDELMEKWVREFDPDGNFTYNYETAKVWQGLDKLLKELRGN